MDFIDRLLKVLDARGLDQGELESACKLPHGRITKWKKGTGEPTAAQAARIARELDVSMEWLIEGLGEMTRGPAGTELTADQKTVLALFRGSKLSVGDLAERLVLPPDRTPVPPPAPKRLPRKRRKS
jgi:transcriptional regulator with XRE-family HTH domain